jgi:hypothetical protein
VGRIEKLKLKEGGRKNMADNNKSNCCIPRFVCGVIGNGNHCLGFVGDPAEIKSCHHLTVSGDCCSEVLIKDQLRKRLEAYNK